MGEVGVRPKQFPDELVVGELLAVVVGRGENLVAAIPMASRIADPTSRASVEAASQMSVERLRLSTMVTSTGPPVLPMTVSISQSPMRERSPTTGGRSSIIT